MKSNKAITMSSGHSKYVSGAIGIVNEVTEARKIVNAISDELSKVMTVYTFHDNVSRTQRDNINTIVKFHNSTKRLGDYSIHLNSSGATTNKELGVEVLYYNEENRKHAEDLAKAISEATGLNNRGAKKRTNLGFLAGTNEPAWLIEAYFVNSKLDAAEMDEPIELKQFAQATAKTIAEYWGIKYEITDKAEEDEMPFLSKAMKEKYEERKTSPATKKLLIETLLSIPDEDLKMNKEYWKKQYEANTIQEGDWNTIAYEVAIYLAKKSNK